MLTLQHVGIGYGTKCIVKNLCASLSEGTLTALLGSNGCGKSTLLRTLAQLQKPLEGQMICKGNDLSRLAPRTLAQTVSIVLTHKPEDHTLTAGEVVEMGRLPYARWFTSVGRDKDESVERALQLTRTTHLVHRPLCTLSDGERQRIFIAKALAQNTPLILLDEPTAFLDFATKVHTLRLLAHLAHTERKTILLSTHDVELALHTADNLWLLNAEGITEGTPQALAENGAIAQFFEANDIHFDPVSQRFCY